jgi:hypothetical protein
MRNTLYAATIVAVALAAGQARAEEYTARLTGTAEVPSVTTTAGTGAAKVSLDPATKKLEWSITYSKLSGPPTMAHFHGPAGAGANAPPVITITPPLDSPISGSAVLTDAQIADLKAGSWYINIHTAQNPKGEIRGQVVHAH